MVQSWRGVDSLSQGASQGYTGILSAPYYLDAQKTSEEMFLADPIPSGTTLTPDQQKLILGGEVCMWSEQIHPETIDSRVWPRTLAIAERFWSPQSDRDVADMYRRLRLASLELEDAGLTHISGPQKVRRNLAGSAHPEALDVFASVLEPVSFDTRSETQRTDAYTSLNRLVDAVAADPPARQEIAREVDAVVNHASNSASAAIQLRNRFESWQRSAPFMQAWATRSPRLSDVASRARQFSALAQSGLEALAYIDMHTTPPSAWLDTQKAILAEADKPSALVRFVFLPALQRLVDTAAAGGSAATVAQEFIQRQ
jgi:hexosaminidase